MTKTKRDPVREERIYNEAVVDAYGPEEQALGWYYYLENKIRFPFQADAPSPKPLHHSATAKQSKSGVWRRKMSAPRTWCRSPGTAEP
jgi:Calcium binding